MYYEDADTSAEQEIRVEQECDHEEDEEAVDETLNPSTEVLHRG